MLSSLRFRHFGTTWTVGLFLFLLLSACSSEQVPPKADLSEFILSDSLQIELVANEPMVILPVAMTQDDSGRIWVVEMPGYMRDINGSGETIADGRIVRLKDNNGDGIADKRVVFLDSLLNPRSLTFAYGGLLYTDGTALKWVNTSNDEVGKTVIVDSVYVIGGNIEHQPNGLLYHLDNWIYSAKSNVRYQQKNGVWKKEVTSFRGQWGIAMDQYGRLLYNNNSVPLAGDFTLPNVILQNPYLPIKEHTSILYTKDFEVFPIQATAVNRGYQDGVLDENGKLKAYTSACSPLAFYGSKLPVSYQGNAFVCAPEANLIARYQLHQNGFQLEAERPDSTTEFLVSKEESFRPVGLHTSYDGALYIVDMRKGIIQHSAYMSSYLREKILQKGLEKINNRGRIYRVSAKQQDYEKQNLSRIDLADYPLLLQHPSLSLRMQVQKILVHRKDPASVNALVNIAKEDSSPVGQIHALWTLQGMDLLEASTLLAAAASPHETVLSHVLILSARQSSFSPALNELYQKLSSSEHPLLHHSLALTTGGNPSLENIWLDLAFRYQQDPLLSEALLSSISGQEVHYLQKLKRLTPNSVLLQLLKQTIENRRQQNSQLPQIAAAPYDDDRTNGLKFYKTQCASCHGIDGRGQANTAPSLIASSIVKGSEQKIAEIILYGYQSGTQSYPIPMPQYVNAPNISDQDIVDIISYLKSTFTKDWNRLKVEEVAELRKIGK